MRMRAEWMNKATNPVLEVLDQATTANLWLSKSDINANIQLLSGDQPSKNTVYRAFGDLVDYGFIRPCDSDSSMLQITERGRGYLQGELDASQIEPVDETSS